MIPLFRVFMAPGTPEHVSKVLESGYVGQGPQVEAFERALKDLIGTPVLTLNSCTSALDLALHLCDVGPGDEVITTPITCTATNGVIVRRGARPVWADVHPHTGLIDHEDVKRKLTPRTRAVMAVDWGGSQPDYPSLRACGQPVIQDAAHNILGPPRGDYVCYSFQAIKHLTTGDGGGLIVPKAQYRRAKLLRWYGLDRESSKNFRCSQNIKEVGYKYHMNDIAASIGLSNLPHIKHIVDTHRGNARYYLEHVQSRDGLWLPRWDRNSSWWLFTVLVDDPVRFQKHMSQRGVEVSPVHGRNDRHLAFNYPNGSLPGVDYFSDHEFAVPVGWWLTPSERDQIVEALSQWSNVPTGSAA